MTKKGQTPLEYLLIAIVGIVILASVLIFMNTSGSSTAGEAANKTNEYICRSTACYNNGNCDGTEACVLIGYANCVGNITTRTGNVIPGHCSPMPGGPPCNNESLAVLNCSDFNNRYNDAASGQITCDRGGYQFNLSECCTTGIFRNAMDKNDLATFGYIISEDALYTWDGIYNLCLTNPASCIGLEVTMTSGPFNGTTYTITDFLRWMGNMYSQLPSVGVDFAPTTGNIWSMPITWTYKVCGQVTAGPVESIPYCGNNITDIGIGETCDGTDLGGKICSTYAFGYVGGNLKCNPPLSASECQLNASGCYYYDGVVDFIRNPDPTDCAGGYTRDVLCTANPYNANWWWLFAGRKVSFYSGPLNGTNWTLVPVLWYWSPWGWFWGYSEDCTPLNGDVQTMNLVTTGMDRCPGPCDNSTCRDAVIGLQGSRFKIYDP